MTEIPVLTARTSVASFGDYHDAQRAVDFLSDQKFPVERLTILGSELCLVERVLGRMTWGRALGAGAMSGAWFGLLVGLLLSLFAPREVSGLALMFSALAWGAIFGAVLGAATHAMTRGGHDFVSRSQIVPRHFQVVADVEVAEHVRDLLGAAH